MDPTLYNLLAQRAAVKLEEHGLRHSRGSVRNYLAIKYKCKRKEVLGRLEQDIEDRKNFLGIGEQLELPEVDRKVAPN